MSLDRQLEELQLLQCSLLPGELLIFLEEADTWNGLLTAYPDAVKVSHVSEPSFQIKIDQAQVCFDVVLPRSYLDAGAGPLVSVRGDIARAEQERWQKIIKEKLDELKGSEYPTYELFSLHLLPLLHEEYDGVPALDEASQKTSPPTPVPTAVNYHALFTSHHLVSPQKRRSMQQWSSELSISGFAKVGYPGVIYAEGAQDNVEKFVANVKAMQWLALRVRFVEPVNPGEAYERRWTEFQKVGEVVEEMTRIGREEFILEMGIGSAGSQ